MMFARLDWSTEIAITMPNLRGRAFTLVFRHLRVARSMSSDSGHWKGKSKLVATEPLCASIVLERLITNRKDALDRDGT
jgi:hypothetical protein